MTTNITDRFAFIPADPGWRAVNLDRYTLREEPVIAWAIQASELGHGRHWNFMAIPVTSSNENSDGLKDPLGQYWMHDGGGPFEQDEFVKFLREQNKQSATGE
jgi:hypothetical protein